jgi:hypothetical protein
MRPAPGDRGAWSHAPVARVQARPAAPATPEPPPALRPDPATFARRPLPPLPASRTALREAAPFAGRTAPAAWPARPAGPVRPMPQSFPPGRNGFGLPSLRRNVCPHFYMTGSRGAIPIQAPHLLKGLLRQPNNVSRCQLRGGVHLDEGYVNDVCLTPRFNQCVFYEDELSRE